MLDWFASLSLFDGVLMIVGLALIIGTGVWGLRTVRGDLAGGSKTRAGKQLRRYAALHGCKLLDDVTLPGEHTSPQVHHLLIGPFGLLFITVLAEVGAYYGDDDGADWVILPDQGAKKHLPNPLKNGTEAMEAARRLFASHNLYKIPMEQLVILLPKFNDKRELGVRESLPVVNVRRLSARLSSSKYEQDAGVEVEHLTALLRRASEESGK